MQFFCLCVHLHNEDANAQRWHTPKLSGRKTTKTDFMAFGVCCSVYLESWHLNVILILRQYLPYLRSLLSCQVSWLRICVLCVVFLCLVLSCGLLYLISMSLYRVLLCCMFWFSMPHCVSCVLPSVCSTVPSMLSPLCSSPSLSHLLVHLTCSSSCR